MSNNQNTTENASGSSPPKNNKLIIESVCNNGARFRPSDWAERLSSSMANFGPDKKLRYTSAVHPGIVNDCKCLIVETTLVEQHPASFNSIIDFARTNNLRMYEI